MQSFNFNILRVFIRYHFTAFLFFKQYFCVCFWKAGAWNFGLYNNCLMLVAELQSKLTHRHSNQAILIWVPPLTEGKISVIKLYARKQNTTILTKSHNERYLSSICVEENKIQLFLLKAIENMWYKLDFQLMLHKLLVIDWNSQRLWKVVVFEFWTI